MGVASTPHQISSAYQPSYKFAAMGNNNILLLIAIDKTFFLLFATFVGGQHPMVFLQYCAIGNFAYEHNILPVQYEPKPCFYHNFVEHVMKNHKDGEL
jgi:hypothetical protein